MNLNTFLNSVSSSSSSSTSSSLFLPWQKKLVVSAWYSPVKTVASYNDVVVVVIVAITWRKSPTYRVTGRGRATPRCTPPAAELSPAKYRHLVPGKIWIRTWKRQSLRPSQPAIPPGRRSTGDPVEDVCSVIIIIICVLVLFTTTTTATTI